MNDVDAPHVPSSEAELRQMIKIGPIFLTRYERARILGARALQVSMGAPVLVNFSETENPELDDPLLIAELEIQEGILPISIRRSLPDGRFQDIPFSWLIREKGKSGKKTYDKVNKEPNNDSKTE